MNFAVQKRPRRQHHGFAAKTHADLGDCADDTVALHHQVVHGLLEQPQIRLVLQLVANRCFVQDTVGLRPRRPHGRAFGAVENAELNTRFIGRQCHRATHRIDLFDQMAFADTADGGVTAHLPQCLNVVRQEQGFAAHAGAGQCGLGASVAATDDDNVKFLGIVHPSILIYFTFLSPSILHSQFYQVVNAANTNGMPVNKLAYLVNTSLSI